MSESYTNIKVIGVGNVYRQDDGAGWAVLQALPPLPGVKLVEASGEGSALMEAWSDAEAVILIDAVEANEQPGRIYRLDPHREPLPCRFFHYSTHAFSVAEAIGLGLALHRIPPRMILYGIEGAAFGAGVGLTPEVEASVEAVADRIRADVRVLLTSKREGILQGRREVADGA